MAVDITFPSRLASATVDAAYSIDEKEPGKVATGSNDRETTRLFHCRLRSDRPDYFMLVCGPLAFAKSLGAPQGPAQLFAPDGSCLAMAGIGRPSEQGAALQT